MLAPEEIFEIAEEISRKYSPIVSAKPLAVDKRVILTPQQLLEISQEINRKFMPKLNSTAPKLVLLPIDPTHLFASWNLGKPEENLAFKRKTEEHNITLRIYPNPEETINESNVNEWFDVAIKPEQTRQKVTIPKEHKAKSYAAVIGKLDQEKCFTVLAVSEIADTPRADKVAYPIVVTQFPTEGEFRAFSSNQENLPDSRYNVSSRGIH